MRGGRRKVRVALEMADYSKDEQHQNQQHLSGAYIRSLVKHLSSSSPSSSPSKPKLGPNYDHDHDQVSINCNKRLNNDVHEDDDDDGPSQQPPPQKQQQQQQQQHKKQVRRRLHTSRPYQERLLNMAEARREIVAALKFHRAAMKQGGGGGPAATAANNHHHLPQQQQQPVLLVPDDDDHHHHHHQDLPPNKRGAADHHVTKTKSRRNPRNNTAPSPSPNFPNYLQNISPVDHFPPPPPSAHDAYSNWCFPSAIAPPPPPPPLINENLSLNHLPNQTLGLNLSFHDFNNLDSTILYHKSNTIPSSSSSSIYPSRAQEMNAPNNFAEEEEEQTDQFDPPMSVVDSSSNGGVLQQHTTMDEEEMAELRSIGDQHQMEWNDTLNLVTSAWWFKFLNNIDINGPTAATHHHDHDHDDPFDEVMQFPDWLISNGYDDMSFHQQQQHLYHHYPDDCLQDPTLPCMEIGEIEEMDDEWLA